MKFNTRIRYGIRAILEIALEESENGVFQKDISERQKISNKYLDNIITALKTAGLIKNVKGKKSGYKGAFPNSVSHTVKKPEEQQCAEDVQNKIRDMITAGIETKNLVIEHERQPC